MFSYKKRGQTTTFIVVGLLLMITIGMVSFIRNMYFTATDIEVEQIQDQPTTLPPLKIFITQCILRTAKNPIYDIGFLGGTFFDYVPHPTTIPRPYVSFHGDYYGSYCEFSDGEGCVNKMITRKIVEKELSDKILPELNSCINLTLFKKLGYSVNAGTLNVGVTIAYDEVIVNATYPIEIQKVGDSQSETDYFAVIKAPLGKLFDLSVHILNEELENGYFDKDIWMLKNGGEVEIEKHRPYYHEGNYDLPTTIYKLSTNDIDGITYQYLFSLIHENTVKKIGQQIQFNGLSTGALDCNDPSDNNCFRNVPGGGLACSDFGLADGLGTCTGVSSYDPRYSSDYSPCNLTGIPTIGQKVLTHGQSICVSEGPSGKGNDYVGSRFYVVSCNFGKVYVEECADYREEICVYNNTYNENLFEFNLTSSTINFTISSKASCRPNLYHQCYTKITQASCELDLTDDCYWHDPTSYSDGNVPLNIRGMCLPKIAPGFRFWELNGMQICELANDYRTCDELGFSCPQGWTNLLKERCSYLGDCGDYYNYNHTYTENGFLASDDRYPSRPGFEIYSLLAVNPLNISSSFRYPLDVPSNPYDNEEYSYSATMNFLSDYIDEASGWDFFGDWFKYINVLGVKIPTKYIGHVAAVGFCMPWQAEDTFDDMNCGFCGSYEEFFPCTEYKCKSLGSGCNFKWDYASGTGVCSKNLSTDITQFNMTFIGFSDGINHTSDDPPRNEMVDNTDFIGVASKELLVPNLAFNLIFNTSEPTRCKSMELPPYLVDAFSSVPTAMFVSGAEKNYSKTHSLRIVIPSSHEFKNKTLNDLNLTSDLDLYNYVMFPSDYFDIRNPEFAAAMNDYATTNSNPRFNITNILSNISDNRNLLTEFANYTESMLGDSDVLAGEETIYRFIYCETPGGTVNNVPIRKWYPGIADLYNETTNPYFDYIKLRVNVSINHTRAPKIINAEPANNATIYGDMFELKVYTDIPAECRISSNITTDPYFDSAILSDDLLEMSCTGGGFNVIDGHNCRIRLNTSTASPPKQFYIRCRSNPRKVDNYGFRLTAGGSTYINSSANVENGSTYVNISAFPVKVVEFRNPRYINKYDTNMINGTHIIVSTGFVNLSITRNFNSTCLYTDDDFDTFWEEMPLVNDFNQCDSNYCNLTMPAIVPPPPATREYWTIMCINDKDNKAGYVSEKYVYNITGI